MIWLICKTRYTVHVTRNFTKSNDFHGKSAQPVRIQCMLSYNILLCSPFANINIAIFNLLCKIKNSNPCMQLCSFMQ